MPLFLSGLHTLAGTLQSFLRASKTFRVLTTSARLAISNDICKGMLYLTDHRFVHRDLASRNVLVNTQYVCKISDFGMSKMMSEEVDYYRVKGGAVPVSVANFLFNIEISAFWATVAMPKLLQVHPLCPNVPVIACAQCGWLLSGAASPCCAVQHGTSALDWSSWPTVSAACCSK